MESKQEIARLLNTITQQYKAIYLNKHKIPQIELDILKQNVRNLYDKLRALEEENEHLAEDEPRVQFTSEAEKPGEEKKVTTKVEFEGEPLEENPEAQPKEDEQQDTPGTKKERKSSGEEKIKEESKKESIADRYTDEKNTIHDKVSPKDEKSTVASKLEKNPLSDLKAAIGINDKYQFVRELFNGDNKTYNEALNRFNTFNDWKQALNYLNKLADEYNWDDDDPNYQRFYQIISRKFT
ncbi:MAG: hypothetical protein K9I94_06035 [Bacteroidales bacterium]|nr:hypothetical protein [Bacteroidales bacterium]